MESNDNVIIGLDPVIHKGMWIPVSEHEDDKEKIKK